LALFRVLLYLHTCGPSPSTFEKNNARAPPRDTVKLRCFVVIYLQCCTILLVHLVTLEENKRRFCCLDCSVVLSLRCTSFLGFKASFSDSYTFFGFTKGVSLGLYAVSPGLITSVEAVALYPMTPGSILQRQIIYNCFTSRANLLEVRQLKASWR